MCTSSTTQSALINSYSDPVEKLTAHFTPLAINIPYALHLFPETIQQSGETMVNKVIIIINNCTNRLVVNMKNLDTKRNISNITIRK